VQIRPVDNVIPIVEHTEHDDRERRQKRQQPRDKQKVPSQPVYKPNGEVEDDAPPNIDVLV
jgi:hypothetical protein